MKKIADTLVSQILRQVGQHGLVVWFDPDRIYSAVADEIHERGIQVERYDGSFFELRRRLDPALSGTEPPKLVVYLPLDEATARGPLCELLAAGVTMRPGQQPPARNTRLAVVARAALSELLHDDAIDEVVRKVDAGVIGLADLEQLARQGTTSATGSLGLVYETTNPAEIALAFLTAPDHDGTLVAKAAVSELVSLLRHDYGISAEVPADPQDLRRAFAHHCFAVDLRAALGSELPSALATLPRAEPQRATDRCVELIRTWRYRRDLRTAYIEHAGAFEQSPKVRLASVELSLEQLERIVAFRCTEAAYQRAVEQRMLDDAEVGALVQRASKRLESFWSSADPAVMDRWALIAAIGRVLESARRSETAPKGATATAHAFVLNYTGITDPEGEPLCMLDAYHRHMERRFHHFDLDVTGRDELIEQLVSRGRSRYTEAASKLAEDFLGALRAAGFRAGDLPRQRDTFETFVRPALEVGSVAYVLVDALRFEMGRELYQGIRDDYEADLSVTLGTLPSITEVGMAALVPGAHEPVELVLVGDRLGLVVKGKVLKSRQDRMDHFARELGSIVFTTKLDALLPPPAKVKEQIRAARLIVATATDELDGLCERNNAPMARRLMDDVLVQLRRGLRVLFDLGVQTVVITADHGYLFGEELDSSAKIDAPGGQTADLHGRVWVGRGGAASADFVRLSVRDVGLDGDLDIAVPPSLGAFKNKKRSAYFHGGASPQELLVPVCVVRRRARAPETTREVAWTLTPGSKKISTLYLSVQVEGKAVGLFELAPLSVRIEVRDGKKVVSKAIAASYGFEDSTGFLRLDVTEDRRAVRTNTVTLMLLERLPPKPVSVVLVDAASEQVLASIEKVDVAMASF